MHSTAYIIKFIVILTGTVALGLTGLREVTKGAADRNEAVFNKKAILKSISSHLEGELKMPVKDMSDEQVIDIFDSRVKQYVLDMGGNTVDEAAVAAAGHKGGKAENVDMAKEKKKDESDRLLPLFVYDKDGNIFYIISVRGNGLWDEIWGCIALKDDLKTVAGASFDHKAETPGLGAEIKDNPSFPKGFEGKRIYTNDGAYTSIVVRKGGARDKTFEVDGISGATVTCDGVTEMMQRGVKYYEPYFAKIK